MKKLLLILLCLTLIYSCEEEATTPNTNNNGNNSDTFLSINDGTVWFSEEASRESCDFNNIGNYVGFFLFEVDFASIADSLIGFYNANNFLYGRWQVNDTIECDIQSEFINNENSEQWKKVIIKNTPNELEFKQTLISSFWGSSTGQSISIEYSYLYKFTKQGQNQLLYEMFMLPNIENPSTLLLETRLYIKLSQMQNLTCNGLQIIN